MIYFYMFMYQDQEKQFSGILAKFQLFATENNLGETRKNLSLT